MAYVAPSIGPAGLTVPSYQDIVDLYTSNFRSIYGQTVYLGNDSSDFELMSIVALSARDVMQALQMDFNNHAPNFATGPALDSLVKINGLFRKSATFSTCGVTITGVAGTVITNGVVRDVNGNQWNLPSTVTIPGGDVVTVTATCSILGAINALTGDIQFIVTPTSGWTSVTNPAPASVGQPVETDSQLRTRQAVSTELPSITILAGTIAAIAATPNVTRYNVLENPTGGTDGFGNPPHSVTAVVEGGTDLAVATAIFNNRGIGPLTNGTTVVPITDTHTGIVLNIAFDRPTYKPVFVIVNAHLLNGGTSADLDNMKTALVNYLNSLQIGEIVSYGAMIAVAMSVNSNLSAPIVSVHTLFFALTATPTVILDIPMNFNWVAQGIAANITVNSI